MKYDTNKFIVKAREVHGDKYDYSQVDYKGSNIKVKIICPEHGEFWQIPADHLRGRACLKCGQIRCGDKQKQASKEKFIERCKKIHGNKYNYDKVVYVDALTDIIVTCPIHGDFVTKPNRMLNGHGCSKCHFDALRSLFSKGRENFIKDAKEIHGDMFDYSLVDYKNNKTKVKIICNEHGVFETTPEWHLNGCGCPKCEEPLGERKISAYLEEHNIEFQKQYHIEYKGKHYKADFYIPSKNLIIEYNGKQHYSQVKYFGGIKKLKNQKERDVNLRKHCKANNIKLFEITYLQYPIIQQLLDVIFF